MVPGTMSKVQYIRKGDFEWEIPMTGNMRVPGIIFASERILREMDPGAIKQIRDVACLPGIVGASFAMPDAHAGYGFPIGGVAAFDAAKDGVVSAGGVGFDISCGVRTLHTGLTRDDIVAVQEELADALLKAIPCGVGQGGEVTLSADSLDEMLMRGAAWAVEQGYGVPADLERIEDGGLVRGAIPEEISAEAKKRIRNQIGSLGSGNHYLEIQYVAEVLDKGRASLFGLAEGDAMVSIHCGSRGLGHQIGTDYLSEMAPKKKRKGRAADIPNRQLANAPIRSELGRRYLGAMRGGMNCALANRQVLSHFLRRTFADVLPDADLKLLYDVSHNTCKVEQHQVEGKTRKLYVHRKGATRSFPPGHESLPADIRPAGQPVLIGGSMGSSSYILAGTEEAMRKCFGSANHGAGRSLSRSEAKRVFKGADIVESLRHQGVIVRSKSVKSVAEEAPGAYKESSEVVASAVGAGLVAPVARLMPLVCVKG